MTEAELLFTEILKFDRLSLYLNKDLHLNQDKLSSISLVLKRRISGEPIQYVLGKTEFMGLDFKVNQDVFIPRPETEILVEETLRIVRQFASSPVRQLNILDLGTGSGCIAISLAKFLPKIKITATDISNKAIEIAKSNTTLNKVTNKIIFIQSNLFMSYELRTMSYDIIVCNPPYIPTAEIDNLQPEISYEPTIALDGGKDGLDFYRRIIADAPYYLREAGFLIMEMGFNQRKLIENIFQNSGDFQIIETVKDYNDIERVIVAKLIYAKSGYQVIR